VLNPLLDGSRYISGIWRILDSWGNLHSIISGQGPLGWFYGYAAYKPDVHDFTYSLNVLEGVLSEESCERVIKDTIKTMFVEHSDLYKKEFDIDEPPTLVREHYFEVRSEDPIRIRKMMDLAISIPINPPS
jgi:hypothetical protein